MTSQAQRDELQAKIWKIANDVRGAVDGWDLSLSISLAFLRMRWYKDNFYCLLL